MLSGILDFLESLAPILVPKDKKISWNIATKIGNKIKLKPSALLAIPIQNESIDNENPK